MECVSEADKLKCCLKELRILLEAETNLCCPKDDDFLTRFVLAKKYNAKAAFENLRMYFAIRLKHPTSYERLYPSKLKQVLTSGVVRVLKHRDEFKRKIFVFRVGQWDPEVFTFDDVTMSSMMVAEEMTYCEESQKVGAVIIVDHQGLNLSHARQLTVAGLRKLLQMLQDCFPGRYKAIHLVNHPYLFDILFGLAKQFMTNKIKRRIHFHADYISLLKSIPSEILAKSLGGTLLECDAWDEELFGRLYSRDKYYKDLLQYGYKKR